MTRKRSHSVRPPRGAGPQWPRSPGAPPPSRARVARRLGVLAVGTLRRGVDRGTCRSLLRVRAYLSLVDPTTGTGAGHEGTIDTQISRQRAGDRRCRYAAADRGLGRSRRQRGSSSRRDAVGVRVARRTICPKPMRNVVHASEPCRRQPSAAYPITTCRRGCYKGSYPDAAAWATRSRSCKRTG